MSEFYSESDDEVGSTAFGHAVRDESDSTSTEGMNSPAGHSEKKKKKKKKKAKEKEKEREKKKKKKKKKEKEKEKSPKKKKKHSKVELDESLLIDHESRKEKKKRKKLLLKEAAEEGITVEELKKRKKKEKKRQAKLLLKSRASGKSTAAQKLKAKAAATLKKKRAAATGASPKLGKAGGRGRGKTDEKKKKNGYQLWCEDNRKRMQEQNPEMDFVALSKRLGEMWQTKPDREKQLWKRKARELSGGGTAGSGRRKGGPKLLKSGAGGSGGTSSVASPLARSPTPVNGDTSPSQPHSEKNPALLDQLNSMKPPGTSTQDAAAHLKLLGDSLFIIGQKLQAHTTPVAVSGSMSVLLDSLLCTLGPLLVTTRAQPELDGIPPAVLSDTLNSLAHIMPGL